MQVIAVVGPLCAPKNARFQLSRRTRDGPIKATDERRPANDQVQNVIPLKNTVCSEAMSMILLRRSPF